VTGEIWLGDLARALAEIRPETDDDARVIARLLGLAAQVREDAQAEAAPDTAVPDPGPLDEWLSDDDEADQAGTGRAAPATQPSGDLPRLSPVGRRPAPKATGWGVRSLPRVSADNLGRLPEREPLLAPRGGATILQTLIAAQIPEGPLDVPAIVEVLACRRVPERLPREAWPTLRFGVEVLADVGLPMRPFEGDQLQVIRQLRTIVGGQLTSVRYFADIPARGAGPGPRRTWRPYEPPDPGTRVLVLSDFGLAGPATYSYRGAPDEWRSFADTLRRGGCDAVALLPVPPDRWPRWLATLMPLVLWDRSTTAGRAVVALGRR
jgi:hypothetical protein